MPLPFVLSPKFVDEYRSRPTSFGWNGLGEFVFKRTYARDDESWVDVCARVINGMFSIQKLHCERNLIRWDEDKAQRSAMEAFDLLFEMKWTPPGRGLWMMGTPFIHDRLVPEALQNCAFRSTVDISRSYGEPFRWLMENSMLGVGVGFDTLGAASFFVRKPSQSPPWRITIPDSREGWADSVQQLINSYGVANSFPIEFDYSQIRPAGEPIKGFGGVASGPEPLVTLHNSIREILDKKVGSTLDSRDIVDICNLIGRCVVAGNVRRSAEIAIGFAGDSKFIDLKDYSKYPERAAFGWVSNNSVFAFEGMNYGLIAERAYVNGEPGLIWMDNIRQFGRMNGEFDIADRLAMGMNPCGEQPLWDGELCTLVEIHLPRITSKQEFARVVKAAFLYGQSVTLLNPYIDSPVSRKVMMKNRRIGLSLTGQAQFEAARSPAVLEDWMQFGYAMTGVWNEVYADWLRVPLSIRRTSVKPSGSVSLLSGSTPGVHHPISRFQIRRVTVASNSPLVEQMMKAGYPVEPSVYDPSGTMVIEFPVDVGAGVRSEGELTLQEQFQKAARAQALWADNGVSVTVKLDRSRYTPNDVAAMFKLYENKLKAVSVLPLEEGVYEQAPYEAITGEEYLRRQGALKPLHIEAVQSADHTADMFCANDVCEVY